MRSNLTLRVLWSFILGAIAIGLCIGGPWPFALLILTSCVVVVREWAKLIGEERGSPAVWVLIASVCASAIAMTAEFPSLAAGALLLGLLTIAIVAGPKPKRGWLMAGVLYAGLPALGLAWLRSDAALGATAIIFLFAIVWTADSAAYATGRLVGGPKLDTRLSPRKTWSGLIGGSIIPILPAVAFAPYVSGANALSLALLGLVLAISVQIGDLGESAVKRRFGVKDTGKIIPGHGGLLDRVDGLLVAALVACGVALVKNPAQPAEALLLWQ